MLTNCANKTQKRLLNTYCDGGFGNRLNGLITGMVLAELADMELQVTWPVNNWCGAPLSDIFLNKLTVVDRELATYVPERGKYQYLMTEDHLSQGVDYHSPLGFSTLEDLLFAVNSDEKPIFLYTPLIPSCLPLDKVYSCANRLQFLPALTDAANNFLQSKRLDNFYGVQIRKTDFGRNSADDNNLFDLLSAAPSHRFFVCSDDMEVEKRFSQLQNVETYTKSAYVDKMNPGDWMDPTADFSGRVYAGNINRSAQSVCDAIVDLLILSHSQIVRTSGSTFLASALLLQMTRKWASGISKDTDNSITNGLSEQGAD